GGGAPVIGGYLREHRLIDRHEGPGVGPATLSDPANAASASSQGSEVMTNVSPPATISRERTRIDRRRPMRSASSDHPIVRAAEPAADAVRTAPTSIGVRPS